MSIVQNGKPMATGKVELVPSVLCALYLHIQPSLSLFKGCVQQENMHSWIRWLVNVVGQEHIRTGHYYKLVGKKQMACTAIVLRELPPHFQYCVYSRCFQDPEQAHTQDFKRKGNIVFLTILTGLQKNGKYCFFGIARRIIKKVIEKGIHYAARAPCKVKENIVNYHHFKKIIIKECVLNNHLWLIISGVDTISVHVVIVMSLLCFNDMNQGRHFSTEATTFSSLYSFPYCSHSHP